MLDYNDGKTPEAERALTAIIEEISGSDETGLRYELARAYEDRARVLHFARQWKNALRDLDSSQAVAESLGKLSRRQILISIEDLRLRILSAPNTPVNDLASAHRSLDRLRDLGLDNWTLFDLEGQLAFIERRWGDAADAYRRTIEPQDQQGFYDGVARSRMCLCKALIELGDIPAARAELDKALPHFEQYGPVDLLGTTHIAAARIELAEGNPEAGWRLAVSGLEKIEQTIRQFRALFDQQRFISDKFQYYCIVFDLASGQRGTTWRQRAWQIAERAKSFYLCNLVASAEVSLFDGVDPVLHRKLEQLESELDSVQTGNVSQEALQALLSERNRLQAEMMHANPRWASLKMPLQLNIGELIDTLPENWCLLSYFWQDRDDGATLNIFWGRRGASVNRHAVDWNETELDLLERSRAAPAEAGPGNLWVIEEILDKELVAKILPAELLEQLRAGDRILISPHGRLRMLPLHALQLDAGGRLIDRVSVQYIPTLSLLSMDRHQRPASDVLIMGCEQDAFGGRRLPQVPAELNDIRDVWSSSDSTPVTVAKFGTMDSFDEKRPGPGVWSRFGIIHLACHGVFDPDRPMDAALRLGKEAVRATELFGVKIDTRIVSLSACDLGATAFEYDSIKLSSDEWIGITLPLMYAGARIILVSLWPAMDEEAAIVMTDFHKGLAAGQTCEEAFRNAVCDLKNHPVAHWANWYLVGLPEWSDMTPTFQ